MTIRTGVLYLLQHQIVEIARMVEVHSPCEVIKQKVVKLKETLDFEINTLIPFGELGRQDPVICCAFAIEYVARDPEGAEIFAAIYTACERIQALLT